MADVPLEPGETLAWHRGQGTFHRGHDDAFAISDRHAWLYLRRFSLRGRWIQIPLADIDAVAVEPARPWQGLAGPSVFLLIVAAIIAQLWGVIGRHGAVGWIALVLMLAFVAWLLTSFAKSLHGRTRLVLDHRGGRLRWVSYADTHAEEKQYDQALVVEFVTRLGEQGVPVRIGAGLVGSDVGG